jgi:hypothetical protein
MGRLLSLFLGLLIALQANATSPNPYPNEIKGMEFYRRYLTPLRPAQSDSKQVIAVLGADARLELKDWNISVLYSCSEDVLTCSHGPRKDPLYMIVVSPKRRRNLNNFKFPATFSRSYGAISEINIACTIYSDQYGLKYWIASKDSMSHRAGDLVWIQYGSPEKEQPGDQK